MELQHLSTELISRINRSVAGNRQRLRCVQTLAIRGPARPSPRLSTATEVEAASDAVLTCRWPLRAALAALGRAGPRRIHFTTRKTTPYKMLRSLCLLVVVTY